jgi:hypothetical protein
MNSHSAPRAHRETANVERKLARLREPHIIPLTRFVERLRNQRGGGEVVPWFDPYEAGTATRILALLEAPGAKSTGAEGPRAKAKGSGIISCDNNDQTAANMWALLRDAGIDREREFTAWNIVPWYLGTDQKISHPRVSDLNESAPALHELISLLPDLQVVVLLGKNAAKGWKRAATDIKILTIEAPHPSPLVLNGRPQNREAILKALLEAKRIGGLA